MILVKLLLTALLAANMKLCAAIAAALMLLPTVAPNATSLDQIERAWQRQLLLFD